MYYTRAYKSYNKFIHFPNFYQNLGLKGQKLSKFVPIRWHIDPMIQMISQNWNLDLKNAQFWQKMEKIDV